MPIQNPRSGTVSRAGKNKIDFILQQVRLGRYRAPAPLGRKEFQRRRLADAAMRHAY